MNLIFTYDIEKDAENFAKSFSAINDRKPTALQTLYIEQIGDLDPAKVPAFLEAQEIDTAQKLQDIESGWRKIEDSVEERMEKLFDTKLTQDITVYLSANSRCTYSVKGNYFFVYMNGRHTGGTIAHELLHFYTWYSLHAELEAGGVSREKYNDIKESLTELLNTDFADLLPGYIDRGYQQHQAMRGKVRKLREEGKGIKEIILHL